MKNLCQERGIKFKVFIPACHNLFLTRLVQINEYKNYEQFKRELVKVIDYVYFGYSNKYSGYSFPQKENEKIKSWIFYDVEHSCMYPLGKLMLEKLENGKSEIGINVNKQNIEEVLKQERGSVQDYILHNQVYIKRFMSHFNDDVNGIKMNAIKVELIK